jgi:predicted nucleotide-binding protein with TIR-like domain
VWAVSVIMNRALNKPRIFLGSSGEQTRLLQAITRGLEEVADVEPWTTTFNPGRSTLDRLVELSQEVDFAAFVFAQDDWTTTDASQSGEASPRDNVVFEAGLFGGALGIRRTFILHAHGSKLPSDLLGLTSVRYDPATSPAEVRAINKKLRKAIETEGSRGPVEGLWWQLSLTMRSEDEPSAVSLLRISRDRDGDLNVTGRAATGARLRRSAGIRPASSTSGRASALDTRMPRSLRAPARSGWKAPTAPLGTGRHGRIATPG